MAWTLAEVAQGVGSTSEFTNHAMGRVRHGAVDSRQSYIENDALFVALETTSGDGHAYLQQAYDNGCFAALVHKTVENVPENMILIRVSNTLEALQRWAGVVRKGWDFPVVAIIGSNGKTIVKEWAFQLISSEKQVTRSPRSYNSQIGVALSLLGMEAQRKTQKIEIALVEAGISEPAEMERLEAIVKPTDVLFTSLGAAHGLQFSDDLHKLREKWSMAKSANRIFYCADHTAVANPLALPSVPAVTWSLQGRPAQYSVERTEEKHQLVRLRIKGPRGKVDAMVPFNDNALVEDVIHAAVLALEYGVSPESVSALIPQLESLGMRLECLPAVGQGILINDTYTLDDESLRLAFETLKQQPMDLHRMVILGGREQSVRSAAEYRQRIVQLCLSAQVETLWLVGPWSQGPEWKLLPASVQVTHFPSTDAALTAVGQQEWKQQAILLKGARSYEFERFVPFLQAQQHVTVLEIDLQALVENFKFFKNQLRPKTRIMAMVKAMGYGIGAVEVASTLARIRVDYLGVAYTDEGVALRKKGVETPIMVLNPGEQAYATMVQYSLEPEIFDFAGLRSYAKAYQSAPQARGAGRVHIKIDTGMHRLGFDPMDMAQVALELQHHPGIFVATVLTHLAAADDPSHDEFTRQQLHSFTEAADVLEKGLGYTPGRHALNSAAALRFPEHQGSMVRLGLGLYGLSTNPKELPFLRPVATLTTHISQIRTVVKGDSVSYGRCYVADSDRTIATLPIGYADGFPRSLSNGRGSVWLNGVLVPVVGVVCMDMFMVDVTNVPCSVGDKVEIFGPHHSLYTLAHEADTITYEILTGLSPRIKRLFIQPS